MPEKKSIKTFKDLASLVKQERKKQGLNQSDLAGTSNTGRRFIVELEKAKETCQIEKVLNVINMLGLNLYVELDDE